MKATFDGNAIAIIYGELDGKPKRLGTAFCFLRPNWFVTAKHVVIDDATNSPRANLFISSKAGDKPIKVGFGQIIYAHDYHDIALITVGGHYCDKPFYPVHYEHSTENGFFRIGYNPKNNALEIERIKTFEIEIRQRSKEDETVFSFQDLKAIGGNSGGPIICNGGGVIGLITQVNLKTMTCRATSIDTVLKQLQIKTPSK